MSAYVDPTAPAVEYCESAAGSFPERAEAYQAMAADLKDKLWHELSVKLLAFFHSHSDIALYDKVVLPVAKHLYPLHVAEMAAAVANSETDVAAAKAVLENLLQQQQDEKEDILSKLFLQSKLSLLDESPEALAQIRANADLLLPMAPSSEVALVSAAHYHAALAYHLRHGPPEAFYEQAKSFLEFAPVSYQDTIHVRATLDYRKLAVDWCLAALTGDGIYNLGEVLEQNDLLNLIQGTPDAWLVSLVQACADGDLAQLDALTSNNTVPQALAQRATHVREKVTLLGLVNWILQKKDEKKYTFAEISESLHIPLDQVEWVLMRALSVHLVEGWMDQVDQTVMITWVRPRTLSKEQIQALADRFGAWATKVKETQSFMKEAVVV